MQYGIAFGLHYLPLPHANPIAWLLVFGGWMNAFPYLIRGLFGINAFALCGPPETTPFSAAGLDQRAALILAFALLLVRLDDEPCLLSALQLYSGFAIRESLTRVCC